MKIVVATGGTGGHIFPALQTAKVLRAHNHEVVFIGSLGLGQDKLEDQGFKTINIVAKGLTSRSLRGIFDFFLVMLQAMGQTKKALKEIQPDKVMGFGGYGSFATMISAWQLRIPTLIHEQNVVPGKANRFLSGFVQKVAISFKQTQQYFGTKKTIWTGCPCQQNQPVESKEALLKKFSLTPGKKTVLILGGSQGSQKLNEVFFELISSFSQNSDIQAIHMTGKKDYALYLSQYADQNIPVKVFEFISPIEEAYVISDVVIARAGAATVCELGFFAVPSILIPYPLAGGHQKYNAKVLVGLGFAQIIEQKNLTVEVLMKGLQVALSSTSHRDVMKNKIEDIFKQNPANELALAVENL